MQIDGTAPAPGFKDLLATTYDNHAAERDARGEDAWRDPARSAFVDAVKEQGGSRLLEVGAGTGHTARWFADHGLEVVATDLSPGQVASCRAKGLEAYVRDFYDLKFPKASFDAVWAANCLLHVPNADLDAVLHEISRVLTSGGLFYVALWGGISEEGIFDDDFYLPPRFFSFRTDAELRRRLGSVFSIDRFEVLQTDETTDDRLHLQSIVLHKS